MSLRSKNIEAHGAARLGHIVVPEDIDVVSSGGCVKSDHWRCLGVLFWDVEAADESKVGHCSVVGEHHEIEV